MQLGHAVDRRTSTVEEELARALTNTSGVLEGVKTYTIVAK